MYSYNNQRLAALFGAVLQQNISSEGFAWLQEKVSSVITAQQLNTIFVTLPRNTGKQILKVSQDHQQEIAETRKGLIIAGWTADRLARTWLLLQLDTGDKQQYFRSIENLFTAAEVNELVALYSSLPILAWPELWVARCSEGIRNNIADVLRAIMCRNPYPSENLAEPAWNQLVLKAVFTEKPMDEIIGLDDRANERLAKTLSDYAHERWAAHRDVNPHLWRCVGPFLDQELLHDIEKLLSSATDTEKEAAALAIDSSNFHPAKKLLPGDYKTAIENGTLSWNILAKKLNEHVLQP